MCIIWSGHRPIQGGHHNKNWTENGQAQLLFWTLHAYPHSEQTKKILSHSKPLPVSKHKALEWWCFTACFLLGGTAVHCVLNSTTDASIHVLRLYKLFAQGSHCLCDIQYCSNRVLLFRVSIKNSDGTNLSMPMTTNMCTHVHHRANHYMQ